MVILVPDASEMAQEGAEVRPAGSACRRGRLSRRVRRVNNKIETIQSVLRHYFEEIAGGCLGKS